VTTRRKTPEPNKTKRTKKDKVIMSRDETIGKGKRETVARKKGN
jgi:hypothetical protein